MAIAVVLLAISLGTTGPGAAVPIHLAATAQPDLKITILFFTAAWCGPCHAVESIVEKFTRKHSREVRLVAVDFDRSPNEAARWEVRQIPVVILISPQNTILLRADGADRETLKNLPSALELILKREHERS